MSAPDLPDYDTALESARGLLDAAELAECHGALCGLLCRAPESGASEFLQMLEWLRLLEAPTAMLRSALASLVDATRAQLADEAFGLELWLPDDGEPLEIRAAALGQWCTGFLAGLGSGVDGSLEGLGADGREALDDLRKIASAASAGDDATEQEEVAFAEIVEYVRVVTLMLQEDLRPRPPASGAVH